MRKFSVVLVALLVFGLMLGAAGCGGGDGGRNSTRQRVPTEIVVGSDAPYAPWNMWKMARFWVLMRI